MLEQLEARFNSLNRSHGEEPAQIMAGHQLPMPDAAISVTLAK
jgi:hypothetical protein